MTEAEKAMFYATILNGLLASRDMAISDIRKVPIPIVECAVELGDELRAQLLERSNPF